MAPSRAHRCLLLLMRAVGFLIGLLGSAARALDANYRAPRAPPPATEPLLLLSGVRLAEAIRRRKVKSIDVIEAYIARIKDVNPMINAVVKCRFEAAREEAIAVDKQLEEGHEDEATLEKERPFLGVPLTVKEAFELVGMPNSSGLVNRRNLVSQADATVVANLKRAGAIPLGVTNCSELCMWYESSNNVYGRSNNPYNVQCIVGGSSGGEGCALGAACSVIGVGSDIGGSIRMPAFFNGIFGHKPTSGVVSNQGQFPLAAGAQEKYQSTGPMCRYAEDLVPTLRVMAGPGIHRLKLDHKVQMKNLKFYWMEHDGGSLLTSPMDKELLQAQSKVVEHLENVVGASVQHVKLRKMKYSYQLWMAMMSAKHPDGTEALTFRKLLGDHGNPVWPLWELIKWCVRMSSLTIPSIGLCLFENVSFNSETFTRLESLRKSFRAELVELLGNDGVFLYPPHPRLAPKHHFPLSRPFNFSYTAIFNALDLPVTQCPLGLSKEGLPLGIQVVTTPFNDHLTLAVAQHLEDVFGGWVSPGKA
ncbi:LOW QUALITY PROTEIN: fatty-acid amide hydrolase 2 [Tachyglossus aculeatus]|uniref:LOW QUALITY PROTEIN: fatty-acid amide hydrolase 2 n=1 Tax=Tachyglossus aculeatus TaxID=9261 RepID=UPI0018F64A28|nr:LOW QUALITY PROTEIN: fatty-acid amide hydrolase 2 [Tachyglossus aculeatus]